jgi:hypothetical protein
MNEITTTITAGGVSMLLLEGFKWIWRKFVVKDFTYDFPPNFYIVAVPVLNVLIVPLLALLAVEGYTMPADWLGWLREGLLVLIASLISLGGYKIGVQPLKQYRATFLRAIEESEVEEEFNRFIEFISDDTFIGAIANAVSNKMLEDGSLEENENVESPLTNNG